MAGGHQAGLSVGIEHARGRSSGSGRETMLCSPYPRRIVFFFNALRDWSPQTVCLCPDGRREEETPVCSRRHGDGRRGGGGGIPPRCSPVRPQPLMARAKDGGGRGSMFYRETGA
jgi:hypothetical protein